MEENKRPLLEYERIIMDELILNGYPKESIVLEWKIDFRRFVDIVVVDTDTGLPIMMIDIKSCGERTHNSVKQIAFSNLKRYYEKSNAPIKAIAAILNREEKQLELIDFTDAIKENNFNALIENYTLPPYEILTIGAKRKAYNRQKEKQEQRIGVLKILCWAILPVVCLTLLILDALNIYQISTLRLITIGVGVAVTLIPCFKEIKIGEISLNQLEQQTNNRE